MDGSESELQPALCSLQTKSKDEEKETKEWKRKLKLWKQGEAIVK